MCNWSWTMRLIQVISDPTAIRVTEDRAWKRRTEELNLKVPFSCNLLEMSKEPLSERGGAGSAMEELRPQESFIINGALDPEHQPRLWILLFFFHDRNCCSFRGMKLSALWFVCLLVFGIHFSLANTYYPLTFSTKIITNQFAAGT